MDRACQHCVHFVGWRDAGAAHYAVCNISGSTMLRGQPERGCASWEREPGSDDDLDNNIELGNRVVLPVSL